MPVKILLVRHGETEANARRAWQGTANSPLTAAGNRQIEALRRRLAPRRFDAVIASDLGRAVETARAIGEPERDRRWRELSLGSWEGLTQAEIAARDPEAFSALGTGGDIAFGGGERMSEMRGRLTEAFFDLAGSLRPDGTAVVVSHGGAILTLVGALLGVDVFGKVLRLTNTSITVATVADDGAVRVDVFNDASHLPGSPVRAGAGSTHVVLARHGETVANLEGRWQGHSPGELTDLGRAQARLLSPHFASVDVLFSSPLGRARQTAELVADGHGLEIHEVAGLKELGFGRWEMMTFDEVRRAHPVEAKALAAGEDIVRGETGESFAQLQGRVTAAVDDLVRRHPGVTIGAVTHGAATRAYVTGLLGLAYRERERLGLLRNTAMARVVFGSRGPALAAWNVAPHLED